MLITATFGAFSWCFLGRYWANGYPPAPGDTENATVPLCAQKCSSTPACVGFEVYLGYDPKPACYIFKTALKLPFTPNAMCDTCVKATTPVPFADTLRGDERFERSKRHKDQHSPDNDQRDDDERLSHDANPQVLSPHRIASHPNRHKTESEPIETRLNTVRILSSGRLLGGFGLRQWHNIEFSVSGCALNARVDDVAVASVVDTGCVVGGGWGAVGSGWHDAQFKSVSASTPVRLQL